MHVQKLCILSREVATRATRTIFAGQGRESNFAMRLTHENGTWSPEVMWRTTEASPAMASPIVHAGYAYWINRLGVVHCFEARSGKLSYTERTGSELHCIRGD